MSPQTGFKDQAIALYGREGVSAACLLLQERTGLDVNLLLFAAWMGAFRHLPLSPQEVAQAHARVADWHGQVVVPLRAVRRRLKTGPPPAPSERTARLREKLQGIEIAAEIIELEELEGFAARLAETSAAGDGYSMAISGMREVALAAAGRPLDAEEMLAIETIARAADTMPAKGRREEP